jgi:DNA-binding NarL/FixJ family response regulator
LQSVIDHLARNLDDGVPSARRPDGQAVVVAARATALSLVTTPTPTEADVKTALIDQRVLLRECFAKGIESAQRGISVQCFSTVEEWREAPGRRAATSLVLFCTGPRRVATVRRELEMLAEDRGTPVILVSDEEDREEIQEGLQLGVRGFISASVNLHLALRVMQLVSAGGLYVPPSILMAPQHRPPQSENPANGQVRSLFTPRQAGVVEALRQGKPNKIIAYELTMCESTVKVHIRHIMRKLNATNRTQVAFMLTNMEKDNTRTNGGAAAAP